MTQKVPDNIEAFIARTCVITVTYRDRFHLLERVLNATLSTGVARIIVVDNGSASTSASKLRCLAETVGSRLVVVRSENNLGSAGGYKKGLEEAASYNDCEFMWLLDDDNEPQAESLERLCYAHFILGGSPKCVLLSLRRSCSEYVHACTEGQHVAIKPHVFMGFDITRIPGWLIGAFKKRRCNYDIRFPLISIDRAPYGGLFFHKSWLDNIGFPDERLYLYGDDHEYTVRMIQAGARIFLCATSEVVDLETSWWKKAVISHPLIAENSDEERLYYAVRNQSYITRSLRTKHWLYTLNKWSALLYLLLVGLVKEKSLLAVFGRLRLIYEAANDGELARFGQYRK